MIDYGLDIGNTNGVLGDYTGKNASGATATDGTPFIAAMIDDLWGPKQALMDRASLIPNGVTESVAASQILEAMQKGYNLGAGYYKLYAKNASPAVHGDRLIILTGVGVLRTSFPELDTAVYVGDGNNATANEFYRSDDPAGTVRNIAGAYLKLPEGRGMAVRGEDLGAINNPRGAARTLGGLEEDQIQGHIHNVFGQVLANASSPSTGTIQGASGNHDRPISTPVTDGVNGAPRTGADTAMMNISAVLCISY